MSVEKPVDFDNIVEVREVEVTSDLELLEVQCVRKLLGLHLVLMR